MEITVSSTTKIVNLNGVPARVWEGTISTGIPVHCFITRIAVAREKDNSQFEKELQTVVRRQLMLQIYILQA